MESMSSKELNVRRNIDTMLYYTIIISLILHVLLIYFGGYYLVRVDKPTMAKIMNLKKQQGKPMDVIFVKIPDKKAEMPLKRNPDALPSDKDRFSAREKPEHFDPNASKLPEMHGDSKNLVIQEQLPPVKESGGNAGSTAPGSGGTPKTGAGADGPPNPADTKNALKEPVLIFPVNPSGDTGRNSKDLGDALRNLDRYISPNEFLNNPKSSYEPPGEPDSDMWLDTQGVDIGPWAHQVHIRVRNNWILPIAANFGIKGKVVIEFGVQRNGTIQNLVLSSSSGIQAYDQAALSAITMSNPLPPLPDVYPLLVLKACFTFYYNMKEH